MSIEHAHGIAMKHPEGRVQRSARGAGGGAGRRRRDARGDAYKRWRRFVRDNAAVMPPLRSKRSWARAGVQLHHPRLVAPEPGVALGGDGHAQRVRTGDSLRGRPRPVGEAAGRGRTRASRGGPSGRHPVRGEEGDLLGAQQGVAAGNPGWGRTGGEDGREPRGGDDDDGDSDERRREERRAREALGCAGQRGALVPREDQARHRLGPSQSRIRRRREEEATRRRVQGVPASSAVTSRRTAS